MTTQQTHVVRIVLNAGLALLAQLRFWYPQRGMRLVAVTGTDGKTTTVSMLAAMLRQQGQRVGTISTVGADINGRSLELGPHVSTPSPWQLYSLLRYMRREKVQAVIIELTSHGLDQRRTFGLRFDVGVMTNISPEHLDYHGSMARYAAAKARLCQLSKMMVLNHDDPMVAAMTKLTKGWLMFAFTSDSTMWPDDVQTSAEHTTFKLHDDQVWQPVEMPFVGRHNVYNALAAAGAARLLGESLEDIAAGLSESGSVLGRWQVIQQGPFMVVVDFGHTPQAFEQILPLARQYVSGKGRLIHVFGAAGSRDGSKRERMGELSATFADVSVLTMEDPRRESLEEIQNQLIAGFRLAEPHSHVWKRIDDRAEAIDWAVVHAKPGDVVLLTGKGHEKSMNISGQEVPWDEVEVVKKALRQV